MEDAEALADEWLKDLQELRESYWIFSALAGRKVQNDPDAPKQHFDHGYRPLKLGDLARKAAGETGVIDGSETLVGASKQQAKALTVGEYIQRCTKILRNALTNCGAEIHGRRCKSCPWPFSSTCGWGQLILSP